MPKTSGGRADKPSPNRLADQPLPDAPNRVWAGDITFIPTSSGWLYLAIVIDLCSRRIVGWNLTDHLRTDLMVGALNQALGSRSVRHLIFHSDRGSQIWQHRLPQGPGPLRHPAKHVRPRANPYHNAWSESFIGTLKSEMLQGGCFQNADDARLELFDYIEGYYNTHRKHSSLGYKTPNQFEASFNPST